MRKLGHGMVAADAMSGCGGNVIALAASYAHVVGVELDAARCGMMARNAALYGVSGRVDTVAADFFAVAGTLMADAIFCSPPWGGPRYHFSETFDVLAPTIGATRSVKDLLASCLSVVSCTWRRHRGGGPRARIGCGVVALFLPRNTDLSQLEALVPDGAVWQLERNFVNGKLKGITLYAFGDGAPAQAA
eukprot:365011-Chlamydomonas_euryale.AAC.10